MDQEKTLLQNQIGTLRFSVTVGVFVVIIFLALNQYRPDIGLDLRLYISVACGIMINHIEAFFIWFFQLIKRNFTSIKWDD